MTKSMRTQQDSLAIEELAGLGFNLDQIAIRLRIAPRTLDYWLKDPEVRKHYELGRVKIQEFVVSQLMENIRKGKEASIFFYLKTQCGWREVKEEINTDALPEVKIYIPDNGRQVAADNN